MTRLAKAVPAGVDDRNADATGAQCSGMHAGRCALALRSPVVEHMPAETVRVATAAWPTGTVEMTMQAALGMVATNPQVAVLCVPTCAGARPIGSPLTEQHLLRRAGQRLEHALPVAAPWEPFSIPGSG